VIDVSGPELVRRYRDNYGIPDDAPVTEEMALRHWTLERRLTNELLASTAERRWEVFERCYTTLYAELEWLNEFSGAARGESADEGADDWIRLIGPPPRRVYEIGSGKGRLVDALARRGYECTATEITRERGKKWTTEQTSVRWRVSDGVHLNRFERPESYDAVISDQVVEHLHPDDLAAHLRGVHAILRPCGRYALATPHAYEGPFDVSRVFGMDRPAGMHLKEYTHGELQTALRDAGFTRIEAAFRLPRAVRARFGNRPRPVPSRAYFAYLCAVERLIAPLPRHARRSTARAMRLACWTPGITLVAIKPGGDRAMSGREFSH
jgi:SAM-dependent methyltransferase